jgi:SPP1 gp7 family putative phage head morphogenesis protein
VKLRFGAAELLQALAIDQAADEQRAIDALTALLAGEAPSAPQPPQAAAEFFDVPTGDAFDVAPERAINYFRAMGLGNAFAWQDAIDTATAEAFTVAKMMDMDLLAQVRASLESAAANGTPFKDWTREIVPLLKRAGWWGRKPLNDPVTGEVVDAQLGSPSRLETIFRTNLQSAYAAGQWSQIEAQRDTAPLLMYDALDDFRTRPAHRAWDGKLLPVDSPWWRTHYPPNGWNCRCGVIQLSEDEAAQMGLEVSPAPRTRTAAWTNPRTGRVQRVPVGVDPGFDRNAGLDYQQHLNGLAAEKAAALPDDLGAAASRALSNAPKAPRRKP